jgi:hypothetical protein
MIEQKSFGAFIKERFGPNWVYAARCTDNIRARYNKPDCPVVVITPKQQKQLKADYEREWGREYDPQYWAMLSTLRAIHAHAANTRQNPVNAYFIEALAAAAIKIATEGLAP